MRTVKNVDVLGQLTYVLLPDDAPDADAYMGITIGPPSLDELQLPEKIQVRLNNELFNRGLLNVRDVRTRRTDVLGALMSALKVDIDAIVQVYERNS